MNCPPQISNSLPVNDSHSKNFARSTLGEVFRDETFHFARAKCVQIQHAIDRNLNWFVVHLFGLAPLYSPRDKIPAGSVFLCTLKFDFGNYTRREP